MSEARTSKKVKVVGTADFINASTGELLSMNVTTVEERDFNFSKVWMRSFLTTLELVGNAKTKVAYWVIDHINRENQLTYTYRQIAAETGISPDTVTKTMTTLLEADFLRRQNQGCYIVNPNIVFKGTRSGRLNVLTQFGEVDRQEAPEPTPEQQLQNLLQTIQRLTDKANELSEQIKAKAAQEEAPLPGQVTIEDVEAKEAPEAKEDTAAHVAATTKRKNPRRKTR